MRLPLVGRDDVLADVERYWVCGGRAVVIHGPAGVGKTRLARELLARSQRRGVETSWSAASRASATIPYAALWQLLPAAASTPSAPDVALQSYRRHLEQRAARGRLLIAIDDAYLLDAASLALVHALTAVPQVSLVVTVRDGEHVPEELTGLWKDGDALRVDLEPLDRAASDRLAADLLGDRPTTTRCRRCGARPGETRCSCVRCCSGPGNRAASSTPGTGGRWSAIRGCRTGWATWSQRGWRALVMPLAEGSSH